MVNRYITALLVVLAATGMEAQTYQQALRFALTDISYDEFIQQPEAKALEEDILSVIKAIKEAEAYPGPSLIIGYSPCEMHSIKKGGMQNCQAEMKKAVECGYWNLFRFNPEAAAGKKFSLDSKEPAGGYQEFLMNEARYSRLTREFPDRAETLFKRNEEVAMDRYQHLLKLQAMYQYTGRSGHDTQLDRDNDDLGISTHTASVQLQYCF